MNFLKITDFEKLELQKILDLSAELFSAAENPDSTVYQALDIYFYRFLQNIALWNDNFAVLIAPPSHP